MVDPVQGARPVQSAGTSGIVKDGPKIFGKASQVAPNALLDVYMFCPAGAPDSSKMFH